MSLVECVPNFSEGRRGDVIDLIVRAIERVPHVDVLDRSSDADHNRTVITFIGEPDAAVQAAFAAVRIAAEHIDLDAHQGVHPRIGAADVVPFIPLRKISMEDCVVLARRLGQRIGTDLRLPVYLYENAAQRPDRVNLANIRRGGYEQLKQTIAVEASRQPDYGPAYIGSSGAVAVGARGPLIAFNAYLSTTDLKIAQVIARRVRESGGGLRFVKALGLLVGGQAQVSMNVIDFRQTGLHTILEAVREEAKRLQVTVTHTELVGLVPRTALIGAALDYLGLPASTRTLLLEDRIGIVTNDYREIAFE